MPVLQWWMMMLTQRPIVIPVTVSSLMMPLRWSQRSCPIQRGSKPPHRSTRSSKTSVHLVGVFRILLVHLESAFVLIHWRRVRCGYGDFAHHQSGSRNTCNRYTKRIWRVSRLTQPLVISRKELALICQPMHTQLSGGEAAALLHVAACAPHFDPFTCWKMPVMAELRSSYCVMSK